MNIKLNLLKRIRTCLYIMVCGLFLSGITAYPIETELKILFDNSAGATEFARQWIGTVYHAVSDTNKHYPYLSYGTDWLAFAHLLFALLFAGAIKDPVRNKWIVEFGIIAAVAIFFEAFIAGNYRSIPLFWKLIDCSFGVVALLAMVPCYFMIKQLENAQEK